MASQYDLTITPESLADGNNTISIQLEMVGHGTAVLELGCATGKVTRLLKARGCTVTSVEAVAEWAEQARPVCDRLIVGNLEDERTVRQISGPFDVILAGDVLEHLRDPGALMRALRHALRPDGSWVISVPNVAHWSVRKELLQGRFDLTDTGVMDRTHLRWFTVRSLREMIEGTGYRVQRLEAAYTLPMQDALGLRGAAARLRKTHLWPGLFGIQLVAQAGLAG